MTPEPYIRMISGRKVFLREPGLNDELHLDDFAHNLARIARFTGATTRPYSVGAHCMMVADLVPPAYEAAALLHDLAEAVLSDISAPLKSLLPDYRGLEHRWNEALQTRLLYRWEKVPEIKTADRLAFAIERRDLCPYEDAAAYWDVETAVEIPRGAPGVGKYLVGPVSTASMWLARACGLGVPMVF